MLGRNKESQRPTHNARPLTDLADPDSFAPPPKRTGTGLAPAPAPTGEKRQVVMAPSKYQDPRAPAVTPPPKVSSSRQLEQAPLQEEQEHADGPPPPYRNNTTGLRTDHLPLPPGRRDGANGKPASMQQQTPAPPKPKALTGPAPSLPPRLPPRGAATQQQNSPQSTGELNQGSVNRLGDAGVSVPGFGIGRNNSPPAATNNSAASSHVNELQNRFANLKTSQPPAEQQTTSSQGTTWAQKQAALKTASQFQKDPSSVSMSDAKSAASTANNFRQRHGDQVATGMQQANSLNNKYGLSDKVGGAASRLQGQQPSQAEAQQHGVVGKKKPPPPPPAKKPQLLPTAGEEPPPVPMSTRPTF